MAANSPTFEVAGLAHCAALAPLLRPEDVAEAEAMVEGYSSPLDCLERAVGASSAAWAASVGGEVAAMFGVVPLEGSAMAPPAAQIWFVTGRGFPRHRLAFARVARPIMRDLLARFGALSNFIDARYPAAVRWARWLGFIVGAPVPFGPLGLPFHPAHLGRL